MGESQAAPFPTGIPASGIVCVRFYCRACKAFSSSVYSVVMPHNRRYWACGDCDAFVEPEVAVRLSHCRYEKDSKQVTIIPDVPTDEGDNEDNSR